MKVVYNVVAVVASLCHDTPAPLPHHTPHHTPLLLIVEFLVVINGTGQAITELTDRPITERRQISLTTPLTIEFPL